MKEYKLVQYNGDVQEENTQTGAVQAGNVYKAFGENAGGIGTEGGVIGEGGENFGVNASTINGQAGQNVSAGNTALPQKVGLWGKVKNFLFQEIDLNKKIVLELTPKEEKVLKEVHDFWFQDVHFPELHDFLFQEITIFGKKK